MEKGSEKKFIFICTGSDCKKKGSKKFAKTLTKEVKNAGVKLTVGIVKCKCMGYCKKGPNVIADNQLLHRVAEDDLPEIISAVTFKSTKLTN